MLRDTDLSAVRAATCKCELVDVMRQTEGWSFKSSN